MNDMADDSVQKIKERLSIVDVVSPYVELHNAGKHLKGKSPFTNEKTPSFYVSPDRGMYYCFSSSQGGDMFTFVQAMEGLDFKGALALLAEKAGVELVPEDPKKRSERDRMYDALSEATAFYGEALEREPEAHAYLTKRGISEKTIVRWQLGYAPGPPAHGWRALKEHLQGKGFAIPELLNAGLIKGADSGKEPYDVFRDRVMFPIADASGRVVAFSGRILHPQEDTPKYVNSPETELFDKSSILYGYDKAKQGIRTYDFSLIVEGQFDVVLAHQAGYTNTVAVSGTALTDHHVMLLQRLSNNVVLALDADRAGIAAVQRAAQLMLRRGIDVKVAHMPDGKDPADMINDDSASFKDVIKHAVHVIEYLLSILKQQVADERTFKLRVREAVLPYVAKIPNKIDQDHFEGVIADALQTTKDAIHYEVERLVEKNMEEGGMTSQNITQSSPNTTPSDPSSRKERLEEYLTILYDVVPTDVQDVLKREFERITGKTITQVRESADQKTVSRLTFTVEEEVADMSPRVLRENIIDKLNELSRSIQKNELRELRALLHDAEAQNDEPQLEKLTQQISDIHRKYDLQLTLEVFPGMERKG